MKAWLVPSLILLPLLAGCSPPEPVTWTWHELVPGDDIAWALAAGPDDPWVGGGLTHPGGFRDPSAHAVKLSASGEEIWRYAADIGILSKAKAICAYPGGGYLLAGYTVPVEEAMDELGERSDALVIRLDEAGNELWTVTWGEDDQDVAMGVEVLPGGDVIVTGTTRAGRPKSRDAFLLRLTPDGDEVWSRRYGGPAADRGLAVTVLPDGNIAMAGRLATVDGLERNVDIRRLSPDERARLAEEVQGDAWLLVTGDDGTIRWERTFGGEKDDAFNHVEPTPDGGFILAGYTASDDTRMYTQTLVVKTDASGEEMWRHTWGHPRWKDEAEVVRVMNDGYLVGGRATFNVVDGQCLLLKLGADGSLLDQQVWGTEHVFDQIYDLILHPDGRTLVWAGAYTIDRDLEDEFTVERRTIEFPEEHLDDRWRPEDERREDERLKDER